jgi:LPXTG-site transpeptidase (sortase) family protein
VAVLILAGVAGWLVIFGGMEAQAVKMSPAPLPAPGASPTASGTPVEFPALRLLEARATADALLSSSPTTAPPISTPPGRAAELPTRLVISRLGLDVPVLLAPVEGPSWRVNHLGQAAGYLEGTARPGASSNLVLAGHVTLADGQPGPFAHLDQLAAGNRVALYVGEHPFVYEVDHTQVVDRTAAEVTYPTQTAQITLITCQQWDDQAGRYLRRLVVKGHLVEQ